MADLQCKILTPGIRQCTAFWSLPAPLVFSEKQKQKYKNTPELQPPSLMAQMPKPAHAEVAVRSSEQPYQTSASASSSCPWSVGTSACGISSCDFILDHLPWTQGSLAYSLECWHLHLDHFPTMACQSSFLYIFCGPRVSTVLDKLTFWAIIKNDYFRITPSNEVLGSSFVKDTIVPVPSSGFCRFPAVLTWPCFLWLPLRLLFSPFKGILLWFGG